LHWIVEFFQLIWNWSFHEIKIVFMEQIPQFDSLRAWQRLLVVVVISAIIYLLYYFFRDVVLAIKQVLTAFISVLTAIVQNLPQVLIAGIIAAGGSWAINHVSVSWWP